MVRSEADPDYLAGKSVVAQFPPLKKALVYGSEALAAQFSDAELYQNADELRVFGALQAQRQAARAGAVQVGAQRRPALAQEGGQLRRRPGTRRAGGGAGEQRLLAEALATRGIPLIVDEVYHPIYHGAPARSAGEYTRATVLGDFSKSFGLPGLRIGWLLERGFKLEHIRGAVLTHMYEEESSWFLHLKDKSDRNEQLTSRFREEFAGLSDCFSMIEPTPGAERVRRDHLLDLLYRRAQVVFTGGRSLYNAKKNRHRNVHCFPSSVDAAHFAAARGAVADPADQAARAQAVRDYLASHGVAPDRIRAEGVSFANAEWGKADYLLDAEASRRATSVRSATRLAMSSK